jgi:hypothetical protein
MSLIFRVCMRSPPTYVPFSFEQVDCVDACVVGLSFTSRSLAICCFIQARIPSLEHVDVESRMLIGRLLLQQKLQPHGTQMTTSAPKQRRDTQAWGPEYTATPTIAMTDAPPPLSGSRVRGLCMALLVAFMAILTWSMFRTFASRCVSPACWLLGSCFRSHISSGSSVYPHSHSMRVCGCYVESLIFLRVQTPSWTN